MASANLLHCSTVMKVSTRTASRSPYIRVAGLAIHIRDSLPGGTLAGGTSRPGRMAVNTLYLTVGVLGSGFAFATPGIMGSMTAREASLIISRRFIFKSRFQGEAALPQQFADPSR